MLGPGLFGIFAAIIVAVPGVLRALFPGIEWNSPYFILALTVIAIPLQRRLGRSDRATAFPKGYYEGLSDLRIHIHLPSGPETSESASRWMMRGAMSFLLALFGGVAGSEGAAVEFIHGITLRSRGRVVRWFEQRRRTDAGVTLAAAIAAVFGAPFAAMLVPMELGIGGRTLSVAFGAISAYLTSRYLTQFMAWSMLPIGGLDLSVALQGFHLIHLTTWLAVGFIALVSGVLGALVIRFVRYGQESLVELFDAPAWLHVMIGGGLLALVFWIYQAGHAPSWMLLNMALSPQASASEVGLLFLVGLLSLTLVLSAFGTVGIFWPLFSLGSFGGLLVNSMVFGGVPGFTGVAALIGGAAFWGAVLGTPLAGAVLAFELTRNINVLIPCFLAALAARQIRAWLRTETLVDKTMGARGVTIVEGRAVSVLESLSVRDAMVTDHEIVYEQESVSAIYPRLAHAKYPFFPVYNSQHVYSGLLTADVVAEAWRAHDPKASHMPLSQLLEAKDLLYRYGLKPPTVKMHDRLTMVTGLFDEVPCVPVLGDRGEVVGLLFIHNVRFSYECGVAHHSLLQNLGR